MRVSQLQSLEGTVHTRPPSLLASAASLGIPRATLMFDYWEEGLTELTEGCCPQQLWFITGKGYRLKAAKVRGL